MRRAAVRSPVAERESGWIRSLPCGLMRRAARLVGTLLIAIGALGLTWVVLVWQWQDPFTALYTHLEQRHLAPQYKHRGAAFAPRVRVAGGGRSGGVLGCA